MWPLLLILALSSGAGPKGQQPPQPGPGPQPGPKPKPPGPGPAPPYKPGPDEEDPNYLGPYPFGKDAGPLQGTPEQVIAENGIVYAPYDMINLAESDESLYPISLTLIPAAEREAILRAHVGLAGPVHLLENRIKAVAPQKGAASGPDMSQSLMHGVTRKQFVGYHYWLAAMAARGGDSAKRQVPKTPEEKDAMHAAMEVAGGTILDPGWPANA